MTSRGGGTRFRMSLLVSPLLLLVACTDSTPATRDPAPAVERQGPITVSGTGISNSDPFQLNGGDYHIAWTATPDHDIGCYHGASLAPTVGTGSEHLVNELLDSAAPMTGTTNVYGMEPGQYYINASSGCAWEFVISQR